MMNNNLVTQFLTQINDAIDYKLNGLSQIKSAVVHSVNQDDTVNIFIPPSSTIYHNVQNQSIYRNLNPGDNIKVIVENGNLSNMWIIGGFNLSVNNTNNQFVDSNDININQFNSTNSNISQDNTQSNLINLDMVYPVGSIYMSVNDVNPQALFGGQWERIKDRFLLASGNTYENGQNGGVAKYQLKREEMPAHTHEELLYVNYDASTTVPAGFCRIPTNAYLFSTTAVSNKNVGAFGTTTSTGGGGAHENMPPYLVVNIWKRIA